MPVIWLDEDVAMQYLATRFDGRLATVSTSGEPYITPLHYVLCKGKLYFHCSTKGKKLENIRTNNSVCFEVSEAEQSVFSSSACDCATRYSSVLVFGTARLLADYADKAEILNVMAGVFSAGRPIYPINIEMAKSCAVVEITINRITGKRNVNPEAIAPSDKE